MERAVTPVSERVNVQRDFIEQVQGTLMEKAVSAADNHKFIDGSHYDYFVHAFATLDRAKATLLRIGADQDEK